MFKHLKDLTLEKFSFLLLVSILILIFHFIYTGFLVLTEPFSLNQMEGSNLFFSLRILSGEPLYPNILEPPFLINNYPPLYYFFNIPFLLIFGRGIFSLRLLTIISEVLLAYTVSNIIGTFVINKKSRLLGFSLVLGLFSIHKFHGLARVDFLSSFLSLTAIYHLHTYIKLKHKSRKHLILSFLLFQLSLLTKQTSVILLISLLFLGIIQKVNKQKKANQLIAFSLTSLFINLILAFIFNILTQGEYLKLIYLYQPAPGINVAVAFNYIKELFSFYWLIIIPTFILLSKSKQKNLYSYLLFVSMLWFLISIFKHGGDLNYSIDFLSLLIINLIICSNNFIGNNNQQKIKNTSTIPLILTYLYLISSMILIRGYYHRLFLLPESKDDRKIISHFVEESSGMIIAEDYFFPTIYQKQALVNDPFLFSALIRSGKFDNPLTNYLTQNKVQRIFAGQLVDQIPELKHTLDSDYQIIFSSSTDIVHTHWKVYELKQP